MKVTDFAKLISKKEGKIKQVDIAQISEILAIIDRMTNGALYAIIRLIPKR